MDIGVWCKKKIAVSWNGTVFLTDNAFLRICVRLYFYNAQSVCNLITNVYFLLISHNVIIYKPMGTLVLGDLFLNKTEFLNSVNFKLLLYCFELNWKNASSKLNFVFFKVKISLQDIASWTTANSQHKVIFFDIEKINYHN